MSYYGNAGYSRYSGTVSPFQGVSQRYAVGNGFQRYGGGGGGLSNGVGGHTRYLYSPDPPAHTAPYGHPGFPGMMSGMSYSPYMGFNSISAREPYRLDYDYSRSIYSKPAYAQTTTPFTAYPPSMGVNPIYNYNSAYMNALHRINDEPMSKDTTYAPRDRSPIQMNSPDFTLNERDARSPLDRYDDKTGEYHRPTEQPATKNNQPAARNNQPEVQNFFDKNNNGIPDHLEGPQKKAQPSNKNDAAYKYENNYVSDPNQKNEKLRTNKLPEVPNKAVYN